MITVDFEHGQLMPAPRKNRPNRREMRFACTCQKCHETRWLRKSDAMRAQQCGRCQRVEAGRKGYAALVASHGRDFALTKVQAYRLANPSKPESLLAEMLSELQPAQYQREIVFAGATRNYILDFVLLANGNVIGAIEVNGWHHTQPARAARDADLSREWPLPLLWLDASNIEIDQVASFVQAVYTAV